VCVSVSVSVCVDVCVCVYFHAYVGQFGRAIFPDPSDSSDILKDLFIK